MGSAAGSSVLNGGVGVQVTFQHAGPPQDPAQSPSSPFLREALTLLYPLDLCISFLRGLLETKTARTWAASLSGEGALVPLIFLERTFYSVAKQ